MDFSTLSITDHQMVAPNIARVVISFTGKHDRESLTAAICKKFDNKVAPVENSFREFGRGMAVGFVRANLDIQVPSQKELKANYRVMGSGNIMMDNRDKSLWKVKQGAAGTYLARHQQEDLSELVNASMYPRSDVPSLSSMTASSSGGKPREYVSFVTDAGDVDHGFITAVSTAGAKMKVMSATTRMEHIVPTDRAVSYCNVQIPAKVHAKLVKAGLSPQQKDLQKQYYEQLFFYAPDYLDEVKKTIDEGTLL